jgi:hypothetical protein
MKPVRPVAGRSNRSSLWSMAYCSWVTPDFYEDEMFHMAQHAQERNLALGVTGALFLSGDQFLQVLEGPRGQVSWLYDRIAADPRHWRVLNVFDQSIERRAFDGWSMRVMAAQELHRAELSAVLGALAWANRLGEVADEVITPDDFADCRAALAASAQREPSPRLHS